MPLLDADALKQEIKNENKTLLDLSGYRTSNLRDWSYHETLVATLRTTHSCFIALPNGRLASASGVSGDNRIHLWDIINKKRITELSGHTQNINTLIVLRDGRLVSGSSDKTIRIWDVKTQQCVVLKGHEDDINALIELPDDCLASGSSDKTIRIWDVKRERCVKVFYGHKKGINALAVSNNRLASCSSDHTIRIWKMTKKESVGVFKIYKGDIKPLNFSSGYSTLSSSIICISNVEKYTLLSQAFPNFPVAFKEYKALSCALTSLPDGSLAIGLNDGIICIWDAKSLPKVIELRGHRGRINALTMLPDKHHLASSADDGTTRFWNITDHQCVATLETEPAVFSSNPSGNLSRSNSITVLPDGHLACKSESNEKDGSCLIFTYPKLTINDLKNLFIELQNNTSLTSVSLQNSQLYDSDAIKLAGHLKLLPNLKEVDVGNTGLTSAGIQTLYLTLKKKYPAIELHHDKGDATYRSLFEEKLHFLKNNPTQGEAQTELLNIIDASHEQLITAVKSMMDDPEQLTMEKVKNLFKEVCWLTDFCLPYTMLNILSIEKPALLPNEHNVLKETLYSTLTWLANNAIVDDKCYADFKAVLNSAGRKHLITPWKSDFLISSAIKTTTFNDPRFLNLKQQIHNIQIQLHGLGQEIQTINSHVDVIANDINNLKVALDRQAKRAAAFGVVKSVLSFCMAAGIADLIQAVWDYSDVFEVSSSLLGTNEQQFRALLDAGKVSLSQKLSTKILEKVQYNDPDKFIEEWYSHTVAWAAKDALANPVAPTSFLPYQKGQINQDSSIMNNELSSTPTRLGPGDEPQERFNGIESIVDAREPTQLRSTEEDERLQLEQKSKTEAVQHQKTKEELARTKEEFQRREEDLQFLLNQQAEKIESEKAEHTRLATEAENKRLALEQKCKMEAAQHQKTKEELARTKKEFQHREKNQQLLLNQQAEKKCLALEQKCKAEAAQHQKTKEELARTKEEFQHREKNQQAEKIEREKAELARLAAEAEKKSQAEEQAMREAKQRQMFFNQQPETVSPQAVSALLKHVAEGEQDKAEDLLKKTPELVLYPADVTDLSRRTFKGITAFQYAVWALDWHMWTMILKCWPKDKIDKIPEQAQELQTGALKDQHGSSVSWQNLLDALQKYIDLCGKSQWGEAATQWNKGVGGAQRLLPAHVVNEYCHPDRPFDPCPDFSTGTLPRTRKTDEGEWFTAKHDGGVLGDSFAVYRRGAPLASGVWAGPARLRAWWGWDPPSFAGAGDLKSSHTLMDTRAQQRDQLLAELLSQPQAYKAGR